MLQSTEFGSQLRMMVTSTWMHVSKVVAVECNDSVRAETLAK